MTPEKHEPENKIFFFSSFICVLVSLCVLLSLSLLPLPPLCACVWYACAHAYILAYMWAHMWGYIYVYANVCRSPRLLLEPSLTASLIVHLGRVSQLNPELTDMASLAS